MSKVIKEREAKFPLITNFKIVVNGKKSEIIKGDLSFLEYNKATQCVSEFTFNKNGYLNDNLFGDIIASFIFKFNEDKSYWINVHSKKDGYKFSGFPFKNEDIDKVEENQKTFGLVIKQKQKEITKIDDDVFVEDFEEYIQYLKFAKSNNLEIEQDCIKNEQHTVYFLGFIDKIQEEIINAYKTDNKQVENCIKIEQLTNMF